MCVAPITLKQDSIKFKSRKAFGLGKSDMINVPCGKCVECRKSYVNGWVFRIMNEYKSSKTRKAYFVTLTYDDESLYNPDNNMISSDGEMCLNYSHHQLYMKKLRHCYDKTDNKIKYFTVGEYGDRSDRPHFHSIIFNADQQNIVDSWQYGSVHFGEVSEASIGYTLKYAFKRIGRVHKRDWKQVSDSRPVEQALISRGIGLDYLSENIKNFYRNDLTKNVIKEGGRELPLPRYYREKIYTEAEREARSRILQKRMDNKVSPEDLRERQALAQKAFGDQEKKAQKRKNTGY